MTEVQFFSSYYLGFDLDVKRPLFRNFTTRDAWFDTVPADGSRSYRTTSTNWNDIGDDMLVGVAIGSIDRFDMGRVRLAATEKWYYFRIRSVSLNETRRTRVSYDIDWELTYCLDYKNGRVIKCPDHNKFAVSTAVNQRRWVYHSSAHIGSGFYIGLALTQLSTSGHASDANPSYNKTGPVFVLLDVSWTTVQSGVVTGYDPVKEFVGKGYCLPSDIVNAWLIPRWYNFHEHNLRFWEGELPAVGTSSINEIIYTQSPSLSQWECTKTISNVKTDLAAGTLSGFCDERGNLLYTVPDMMETGTILYAGFRMSMSSCEVDIALNNEGFVTSHTCNRMWTYCCKTMDVVCDSWQEYAFRQREADIESRKLQNEQALATAGAMAVAGAGIGAVAGTIVPVAGNAVGAGAGALIGGAAGLITAGVQYGISAYYAGPEQNVKDTSTQLQQDSMSVTGGVTSYMIALGCGIMTFTVKCDAATVEQTLARNAIEGVDAAGYSQNIRAEIAASTEPAEGETGGPWAPWACDVEVDYPMPVDRKRSIQETMRNGARWKRFGSWVTASGGAS